MRNCEVERGVLLERIKAKEKDDPWTAASYEVREEVKALDSILGSIGLPNYRFRKDKHFELVDYESAPSIEKSKGKDYLDFYVFPYLLPAIQSLIFFAIEKRLLQCRWSTFSPLDYLAEYLYNANPRHPERNEAPSSIFEAEFAKEWLRKYPRIPYPSWVYMSKEEAGGIIQRYFRGYLVRKRDDVQELRGFWRDLKKDREEKSRTGRMSMDGEEGEDDDEVYDDEEGGGVTPFRSHSEECELCAKFRELVGGFRDSSEIHSKEEKKSGKEWRNPGIVPCNSPAESKVEEVVVGPGGGRDLYDKCCLDVRLIEKAFKTRESEGCKGGFPLEFTNPRLRQAEKLCHSSTVMTTVRKSNEEEALVEESGERAS